MKLKLHRKINFETYKEEGVDGIEIECGIKCSECWCKHQNKCGRKQSFKYHNFQVRLRRKFGFGLPIHIKNEICENLSGTPLCPMNVQRIYSCNDCNYSYYDRDMEGSCNNKQRQEDMKNGIYETSMDRKCKYFEISDFGNNWDRKTGGRVF